MTENQDRIIQMLTPELLKTVLTDMGLGFEIDEDGDLRVEFEYDEDAKCILTFYFILRGGNKDVLDCICRSDQTLSRADMAIWLGYCNEWNASARWPKASIVDLAEDSSTKEVSLEVSLLCKERIDLSNLRRQIRLFISTSFQFWEWLRVKYPDAPTVRGPLPV